MHILQITFFSRGELPTPKGVVIHKIWFVVLDTCSTCSSFKKIYCEKGIACARGFIFDIEVD